jgi:hypothetical protein
MYALYEIAKKKNIGIHLPNKGIKNCENKLKHARFWGAKEVMVNTSPFTLLTRTLSNPSYVCISLE